MAKLTEFVYCTLCWTAVLTLTAQAQYTREWSSTYSTPGNQIDVAKSAAIDNDGNIYVTGTFGYVGYGTIKYNSEGLRQWGALYSPFGVTGLGLAITLDSNGDVIVTGKTGDGDMQIVIGTVKYTPVGLQLWARQYNVPGEKWEATELAVDSHNNVYAAGTKSPLGDPVTDYALVKYDSSGVFQWSAIYAGPGNSWEQLKGLAVDGEGNVYVSGSSIGVGTNFDYATIKYDSNGVQQWVTRYNGPDNPGDGAEALILDNDGNVYITGTSSLNSNPGCCTVKYNPQGVQQWAVYFPDSAASGLSARGYALGRDEQGNIYVTGSGGVTPYQEIITLKYNSEGNLLWAQRFHGPGGGPCWGVDIDLDSRGHVIVAGMVDTDGFGDNQNFALLRYDLEGHLQWSEIFPRQAEVNDLAVNCSGEATIAGDTHSSYPNYLTVKYGPTPGVIARACGYLSSLEISPSNSIQCHYSPNPFNASTAIRYRIPDARNVSLTVYDTTGRLVATLVDGWHEAGTHQVTFDGSRLASGIYLARFQVGEFSDVQKMVLMK